MRKTIRAWICILLAVYSLTSMLPSARAFSDYDRPGQKLAALTFDDGPGPYSDIILDTLKKYDSKATFFMNGYRMQRYADQVRRMAAEGHQIANHTYNHPFLTKLSNAKIRQEIDATSLLLTEITGLSGTGGGGFYLRPPYGDYNQRVISAAGVPIIWCTVDSGDWKYQSASRLVTYTGSVLKDGDIVIMHETHKSTAQGLDALLSALRSKGFELVTLEDLFWRRGISPVSGQVYYSARNTGIDRCEKSLWFDETQLDRHWAADSIERVRSQGLMQGNSFGEFLPNFPMSRGMFVTTLGRLAGVNPKAETDSGFSDLTPEHYAAPYAAWAKETGIMTGLTPDSFGSEQPITRQEMAAALARFLQIQDPGLATTFDLNHYRDMEEIADWAAYGVAVCSACGLLEGSEQAFLPTVDTTRAMGAVVFDRLDRLLSSSTTERFQDTASEPAADHPLDDSAG